MSYSAYTGWGAGVHVVLDPQPRSPGILPAEVISAASGAGYDDGFYITEWRFSFQERGDYKALNTALGLASARRAKITAMTRLQEDDDDVDDFVEIQAWIEKPTPNYDLGFHRDMVYKLTYIRFT
jgi:hypothetical protein